MSSSPTGPLYFDSQDREHRLGPPMVNVYFSQYRGNTG